MHRLVRLFDLQDYSLAAVSSIGLATDRAVCTARIAVSAIVT